MQSLHLGEGGRGAPASVGGGSSLQVQSWAVRPTTLCRSDQGLLQPCGIGLKLEPMQACGRERALTLGSDPKARSAFRC